MFWTQKYLYVPHTNNFLISGKQNLSSFPVSLSSSSASELLSEFRTLQNVLDGSDPHG